MPFFNVFRLPYVFICPRLKNAKMGKKWGNFKGWACCGVFVCGGGYALTKTRKNKNMPAILAKNIQIHFLNLLPYFYPFHLTKQKRAITSPSHSITIFLPSPSTTSTTIPSPLYTSSNPQPTSSLNSLHHNHSPKLSFTIFHLTPISFSSTRRVSFRMVQRILRRVSQSMTSS